MQRRVIGAMLAVIVLIASQALAVSAQGDTGAFQRTWERADRPVAEGSVSRTWMWGPQANTGVISESYVEAPNGQRQVQYYDKSRMEITDPGGNPSAPWYVTNGLLVVELVTGRLQLGNDTFEQYASAQVNAAGDSDDPSGPTYATFAGVLAAPPLSQGSTVTQRIDRAGNVIDDPNMAGHGVTTAYLAPETNHTVASVFWNFMNSSGLVYENGQLVTANLFENPFYATGLPITEPYWASVKVAGSYRDVLIQAFERRVLTYTPGNPAGFEVEAGNVGQHYYHWRYEVIPGGNPPPLDGDTPAEGEVIASYDFSTWEAFDLGNGIYGGPTSDGYAMTLPETGVYGLWADDAEYSDGSYSLDVRVTEPTSLGSACLEVRSVPNDTGNAIVRNYEYCANYWIPDGESEALIYGLQFDSWNGSEYVNLGYWEFDQGVPASAWHKLKLYAQGDTFWLFFDDQLVASTQVDGHDSGRIGILGYNFAGTDQAQASQPSGAPDLQPRDRDLDAHRALQQAGDATTIEFRDLVIRVIE